MEKYKINHACEKYKVQPFKRPFKFIFMYLLYVLFILKIEGIFGKKS